ncbi:MAG: PKD domain-containing protein [Euryarchaeota archaeon]|nr:PKD domain-containing protein [Euryarchaeota archaeon]
MGIDGAEDEPQEDDREEDGRPGDEGAEPSSGDGEVTVGGREEPEVHEVRARPPRRRRRGKGRHGTRRRGPEEPKRDSRTRRLYIIAIALITIVPVVGVAYFFWGPPGSIQKIDLLARPYADPDTGVSGMAIAAFIDAGKPSAFSGKGDLKISLDGTEVYSGQLDISESRAMRNLPLDQFAVGNGDYRVQFSFQGVTTSTFFTTNEIIERLNFTAFNITHITNATLVPDGNARLGYTVTFLSLADITQLATGRDGLQVEVFKNGAPENRFTDTIGTKTQVNKNFPVGGNGNYTLKATFTNSKVKPGSKYHKVEAEARDPYTNTSFVLVSIPPTAVPKTDKTTAQWKLADGGATFRFDALGSVAYEGATIVNYTWDFGDGYGDDSPVTTHTYTMPPVAGQPPLKYVVTLAVVDSNQQSVFEQLELTVTV